MTRFTLGTTPLGNSLAPFQKELVFVVVDVQSNTTVTSRQTILECSLVQ